MNNSISHVSGEGEGVMNEGEGLNVSGEIEQGRKKKEEKKPKQEKSKETITLLFTIRLPEETAIILKKRTVLCHDLENKNNYCLIMLKLLLPYCLIMLNTRGQ
jgi:hypothetical protein